MNYTVLGMDDRGEIYAATLDENGQLTDTSCEVIRPVSKETLDYLRNDEESVLETWQMAVQGDNTRLGLSDYFEQLKDETDDADGEGFPGKDNSGVAALIGDGVGQIARERADADAEAQTGETVGTWESSGWFPPRKRFAVEYASKKLIKEFYKKAGI